MNEPASFPTQRQVAHPEVIKPNKQKIAVKPMVPRIRNTETVSKSSSSSSNDSSLSASQMNALYLEGDTSLSMMSSSKRLWLSSSYRSDGCEATEAETVADWGESSATLSNSKFISSPCRIFNSPTKQKITLLNSASSSTLLSAASVDKDNNNNNNTGKLFGSAKKRKAARRNKRGDLSAADAFARFNASEIALDPRSWDVIRELSRDEEEEEEFSRVEEEEGEDDAESESSHGPLHRQQQKREGWEDVPQSAPKNEEDDDDKSIDPMALWMEPSNNSDEQDDGEDFIQYHVSTSRLSRSNFNLSRQFQKKQQEDDEQSKTLSKLHHDDEDDVDTSVSPDTSLSFLSQVSLGYACDHSVASSITWEEGLEDFERLMDNDDHANDNNSCASSTKHTLEEDVAASLTSPRVLGPMSPTIGSPPAAPKRFHQSWSNFHDSGKIPTLSPLDGPSSRPAIALPIGLDSP